MRPFITSSTFPRITNAALSSYGVGCKLTMAYPRFGSFVIEDLFFFLPPDASLPSSLNSDRDGGASLLRGRVHKLPAGSILKLVPKHKTKSALEQTSCARSQSVWGKGLSQSNKVSFSFPGQDPRLHFRPVCFSPIDSISYSRTYSVLHVSHISVKTGREIDNGWKGREVLDRITKMN